MYEISFIKIGLGFDGYRSYENYSETDPEIAQLVVFDDPSFSSRSANDPIEFDPIKDTYLNIKVSKYLTSHSMNNQ